MHGNKQPEWHTEHTICSYDVDPQLTVRLPALCRFMQEAAYHHAEHLGLGYSQLAEKNLGWVLARQRIEAGRWPKWGETVMLRTWPSGRDRLFFYRDFEITDGDGMRVLRAATAWFVIDIQKRERVGSDFYLNSDLPAVGAKVFDTKLERLQGCGGGRGEPMAVNHGDLDMNGHVNNVRYIEWVLNSLPPEFHHAHTLRELEVNYLAEAICGHAVSVCTEENSPLNLAHRIVTDCADLFRARTAWLPRSSKNPK
jgi:medium-chain acyl-[acyl-carrier-protein] hydrolase